MLTFTLSLSQNYKLFAATILSLAFHRTAIKRIFSKSGLKPNRTFNTKLIKELFGIVAEAA